MTKKDMPDCGDAPSGTKVRTSSQELLQEVMAGAVPAEHYVERMLEHLERTK